MRAIAGLRTDGGTAFCLDASPARWPVAWRRLIEHLQRQRTPEVDAHERREGIRVQLPVPTKRGQTDLDFFADVRDSFPGSPPVAEVIVDGSHREKLVFHVPDRCFVRLTERCDSETGEVTWRCRVEAKAKELYADGLCRWLGRWLGLWGWLMTGSWPTVEGSSAAGWRCTQWHLNADFVGIELSDEDARRFVGVRKFSQYGRGQDVAEQVFRRTLEPRILESATSCPWVQTLVLGRKNSDSQLVIYRKGDQLRETKRLDPARSMYAPLWRAHGWRPEIDGDPLRVELRLRKKGLEYRRRDGSTAWNFRDPAAMLRMSLVRELWWYHTNRRRLVAHGRSRKRRSLIDERWLVVQRLGLPVVDIRQLPRQVRELTRDERIARDVREAVLAAVKFAARSSVAVDNLEEVGDALAVIGRMLQSGAGPYLLASLDSVPDLRCAVERAAASSQFFREQADSENESMVRALDAARGRHLKRRRIWKDEDHGDEKESKESEEGARQESEEAG